jgi:hypothetical protein
MTAITGIRAALPLVELPASTGAEPRRPDMMRNGKSAVATPELRSAVGQVTGLTPQVLALRTSVDIGAAEAAEAARAAYIRASIAAGISPLPLS